jgi:NitT/TauT family transport system ATP-binding protein
VNNIIKVNNLSKEYKLEDGSCLKVLDNISFSIPKNSITGILGQSGCGKTTLLEIVARLQSPSYGDVWTEDNIIPFVIFQQYNKTLFPYFNLEKNVEIVLNKDSNKKEKSLEALHIVGLEKFSKYYPWQLSGGMQQRVCVARALAIKSSIILLDEPFSALDSLSKYKLEDDLLKIIRQFNITCLYVTHDIDSAIYFSDRIIVLNKRPAFIINDFEIKFDDTRNQIETKKSNEFLKYRENVYNMFFDK